jgi:LacI family transcriptional regulator
MAMPLPPPPHVSTFAPESTGQRRRISIVSNFNHPDLCAGAMGYAREHCGGLETVAIRHPGHFPAFEGIAGILASLTLETYRDWVVAKNCPVVHLLENSLTLPPWPLVICDREAAGLMGARHFLELGNLNCAYYRYFDYPGSDESHDAFVREIEAHGRTVRDIGPRQPYNDGRQLSVTLDQRVHWLKPQLAALPLPLAIMADNDAIAIDLTVAARELGLRVPEDVAILGMNNDPMLLGTVSDPHSSIDVNFHEIGRLGCELLHRMLQGAMPGSDEVPLLTKVLPKGVVIRNSTATFRCDHPGVTEAALFVRKHFHESISVRDVAAHANMSLRTLQVYYLQKVGRTVKDDILQERLKRAQSILENSDVKLAAVAVESGFASVENLFRAFQIHHHMTPQAWRMRFRRV